MNKDPLPLKKLGLWSVFTLCIAINCYILLIAFTSVFIGLSNLEQDGSWVPILVGLNIILLCLYLFTVILRFLRGKSRVQDSVNFSN